MCYFLLHVAMADPGFLKGGGGVHPTSKNRGSRRGSNLSPILKSIHRGPGQKDRRARRTARKGGKVKGMKDG